MKILPVFSYSTNIRTCQRNNSDAAGTHNISSGVCDLESQNSMVNRSMVNFKASKSDRDPYKKSRDKVYLNNVAVSLRLTPEQREKMAQITQKFLKEENLESLYQLSGDDSFNLQAVYVETIMHELNLKESDSMLVNAEFFNLYEDKSYKMIKYDYFKDRSLIRKICTENGMSESYLDTFAGLTEILAAKHNLVDIFSLIDKKKCPEGIQKLTDYLTVVCHCTQEQKDEILISFARVNMTPQQEREDPDPEAEHYYQIDADWTNQAYAEVVQKEMDLPNNCVNEIKKIVAEYINPLKDPGEDFVPNVKAAAYYIADKFDLNAKQQSRIVKLFEGAMNNTL